MKLLKSPDFLTDEKFHTWHDHTFSEIIASQMLIDYVIPIWLSSGLMEYFGKTKAFDPEDIRRKLITEQEGVDLVYSNPKGHGPFLHSHDDHGHH